MKYNVKGIIWPMGYMVEVNVDFDTIEEAEAYCADKTAHMCGEQFIITLYMAFESREDWLAADDVDPDAPTDFVEDEIRWAGDVYGYEDTMEDNEE